MGSFCHWCIWGWRGGVSFKPGSYSDGLSRMEWRSCWTLSTTHDNSQAPGPNCPISEFSWPKRQRSHSCGCPDLWFGAFRAPAKGIPITRIISVLGILPLNIQVNAMADSGSISDWESLLCSCSIHRLHW